MASLLPGIVALLLYLAATLLLARRLLAQRGERLPVILLGLAAVVLHGLVLQDDVITANGIDLGFFTILSLVTAIMVLVALLGALRAPIENLGIALMPLAALALLLELLPLPGGHILLRLGPVIEYHVVLSLLAFSLLGIAAFQAGLLAIQDRHLRRHRATGFIQVLPPLETMERMLFQIIVLGMISLSVALLLGFIALDNMFAQHLVHKTVLSLLAWVIFAALLWGRYRYGWRGRLVVRWTLVGTVALVLAYFGTSLVLELILGIR